MTDHLPPARDHSPPDSHVDDSHAGDGPPSRVVPAFLAVLAILPMLMLAFFLPSMFKLVDTGGMRPLDLLATLLVLGLLPLGIVVMFLRKRGAPTVFVLAVLACLQTLGGPFARIVACAGIVAVIGAIAAVLQGRRRRA